VYGSEEKSLQQLRRLLLFYQPKEDVGRLTWYGMRQMATASEGARCVDGPWPKAYLRLSRACTVALRARKDPNEELDRTLLNIMAYSVRRSKHLSRQDAVTYYKTLTGLEDVSASDALQNALIAPLQSSPEAYVGLAVLLGKPLAADMLKLLHSAIQPTTLCEALGALQHSRTANARSRLWLLGNVIALAGPSNSPAYILAISTLLGSLADDIDFENTQFQMDNNITFDHDVLSKVSAMLPLNTFLHEQISSLVDQASIRNLLAASARSAQAVQSSPESAASTFGEGNAQLLAGYALTLLRCFPRRADDIRMWLYLGPTKQAASDLPATQYFWSASKSCTVFDNIRQNSRNVIPLIKTTSPTSQQKDDWTVIMVFLELYTFLLKIMDDEEFMGSGSRRSSSISTANVGELVTFLKNLGFTLYFNASELSDSGDMAARDASSMSLGRHFGKTAGAEPATTALESKPLTLAGLPGLTIDYLKGLVTGLLRAIYERDSRRHFLPKNHWLMTERFDMTAFIPGVVAEEESRHMVQDQEDEDKDDDDLVSDDELGIGSGRRSGGYAALLRSQNARDRAQRKASRKRYLESVAPRLEILQNMPFFIPFTIRVEIFRQFVQLDQEKRRNGHVDPDLWRQSMMFAPPNGIPPRDLLARHHAKIRRKNEFIDAFEQFYELGADLKEPIQITFVDEFDIPEAGIDGGGVTKEFLTSVISQAFNPGEGDKIEHAYFIENEKHLLYPNPTTIEDLKIKLKDAGLRSSMSQMMRGEVKRLLQEYEFLGRVIGKCLYEGILVDVSFAGFFLKKWALTGGANSAPMESGYRANINDLRELDEGLYRGLLALKNAPAEQVDDFGLTFTVDDLVGPDENKRKVIERELMPGGANMPVTAENRLIYINRMSWYRLQGQSAQQTNAFLKGLSSIVQPSWLSMFNQSELQILIGGAAAQIDVADLRRNTQYGGTYMIGDDGAEHPSIQLFWQVMQTLPDEERRKVLKFVTSTPRGPLLGFGQLNPRFSIRDSGSDENRYPTTSTCVNLLKLPMYRSAKMLRDKLLAAVNSGAGFDLS